MSLPFRTRGGEPVQTQKMASAVHHHRSTTKVDHKSFKTKFASKGALKDAAKGKVDGEDRGKRHTPYQQAMSKLARKNQAKQLRNNHKERQDDESRIFHGVSGAPKHVAVVPLSADINISSAIESLSTGVESTVETRQNGTVHVGVERFRRNLLFLPARFDKFNAMDVCKLADWVVFVLAADQAYGEDVDVFLRAVEGQGITNFVAVVQGMNSAVPAPKRSRHLIEMKMAVGTYLPSLDKISSLDSDSDCANLLRTLCTASTKGVRWRDDRSWMLVDEFTRQDDTETQKRSLVVRGVVRGRPLNPDRLVHVTGFGDLKVGTVKQVPSKTNKRKADEMAVEESLAEWGPSENQDTLEEYAPEVAEMKDVADVDAGVIDKKGVLLDDHHYFSDDNSHLPPKPKKLPDGTSSYQSAWYLEDVSDSDDDYEQDEQGDVDMTSEPVAKPEDGFVAENNDEPEPTEYPESEMHVDADEDEEARQLDEYRSRKKEAEDDLEFPDEIELHANVSARERMAKYRGLKSLRTSEWNTNEDKPHEPTEYPRLLHVADHKKSTNIAKKEALVGPIPAGTRVEIVLLDVPQSSSVPTSLFSLHRHEHKHSVINVSMSLNGSADRPVRAKDSLLIQIGHRRLRINPVFSATGNTPNDVHKSLRFLHPGTTATATFTGPVTWGSVPALVFRHRDEAATIDASTKHEDLELIGSATTIPPSTTRVIAKRIILTGHPFKIHKKLVTIRYMFFNREDVTWFAALPLWTKRGRQGFIKEPLGTHGYFKATFDGKINPMDAVGVSLYKRVWPRKCQVIEHL